MGRKNATKNYEKLQIGVFSRTADVPGSRGFGGFWKKNEDTAKFFLTYDSEVGIIKKLVAE